MDVTCLCDGLYVCLKIVKKSEYSRYQNSWKSGGSVYPAGPSVQEVRPSMSPQYGSSLSPIVAQYVPLVAHNTKLTMSLGCKLLPCGTRIPAWHIVYKTLPVQINLFTYSRFSFLLFSLITLFSDACPSCLPHSWSTSLPFLSWPWQYVCLYLFQSKFIIHSLFHT